MDRIQIDTSQNVTLDVPVAGLGDRLIAALIDYAILTGYTVGVFLVVTATGSVGELSAAGALAVVAMAPVLLYFLLCEIFLDGQSIGKRYMAIKVTRRDGTPASIGNYVVRWLLRPIDVSLTSGLGAVLCILVTGTGQRLGDLAASTTVVKVKPQQSVRDLTYTKVDPDHTPLLPEVDRLNDEDVATANDVLEVLKYKRRSHRRKTLGRRTKKALEQKMGISSDLQPRRFLETVVEDYTQVYGQSEET